MGGACGDDFTSTIQLFLIFILAEI